MKKEQELVYGIDLGTTNTCLSAVVGSEATMIEIDGKKTVPSVVAINNGEWLVGQAAKNHMRINPSEAVSSIKRKMDAPSSKVTIGEFSLSPIEISAKILSYLFHKISDNQHPDQPKKVVITVPAWFQDTQRQSTIAAGKKAGLDVIQIINEPTAAALSYDNSKIIDGVEEKWLVYDLGGGTFDVSVLNVTNSTHEVLATAGNTFLGGDDFDSRLVDQFIAYLNDRYNLNFADDSSVCARLRFIAEETKIKLSKETQVKLEEPIPYEGTVFSLDLSLTRAEFESMIKSYVESSLDKVTQVLSESSVNKEQISRLFLVGGSTRIPLISESLTEILGLAPENWNDPDLSVAMGASIQAAINTGIYFERTIVDVSPHSLGVAVMGREDLDQERPTFQMSGNEHPLTFDPLIRRNTRLPASFVKTFYKSFQQQESALIAVYQGESGITRNNSFIGEFVAALENRDQMEIDIRFSYDINGTINIGVEEPGQSQAKTYTMDLSRSSDENSTLTEFRLNDYDNDGFKEAIASEDNSAESMNYLIQKVGEKLQLIPGGNKSIEEYLESYKELLQSEKDSLIDDIEEKLYDWLEADQPET